MQICNERPSDAATIRAVICAAFPLAESTAAEADIVDSLRARGRLALSLVALDRGRIIGHLAFSPVRTVPTGSDDPRQPQAIGFEGPDERRWFGLAPLAVEPSEQGKGVGSALVRKGLEILRGSGACGCVVVGEPDYYGRFGFVSDGRLTFDPVPSRYVQSISFTGGVPTGAVLFDEAFG